jgi:hypothetical protein
MSGNPMWKGGRIRTKSGYIMIRTLDHPRAGRNNGYVFEHILVMEDILGRQLEDGETVHHKNGVKDDNRKKNLELWRGPQPAGVRVSDLVEWAKEVLEKYDK